MYRSTKPVRKCHGCGLNLRDHCGVFGYPHDMWHNHRHCPGYMNEELLARYQAQQERTHPDPKREKRKQAAKIRDTAMHHDGDRHVFFSARP